MKAYKTLLADASAEFSIQKSRFIGNAAPVTTVEAALTFLEHVRRANREANHHCYAYIIGQNAGIMRYSDDSIVVITRYFGGILLGAGGLVRAYSHTCALALDAAKVCEMLPSQRWMFEVEYSLWDRVQYALKGLPVRVESTEFTASVNFGLLCRQADTQTLIDELIRVTDGRVERLMTEEMHAAWEEQTAGEAVPDGHV